MNKQTEIKIAPPVEVITCVDSSLSIDCLA